MAELIPAPFPHLLRRALREAEREQKVFDLPARRFWRGREGLDTSVVVHGHRAASPVGPAAGPHGQMAQNILLSWLAGGRFLELKTVQVDDRLAIPRPCIDMETVGYNVEWSQELRLAESLREYVKGSMLIDVARAEGLLGRPDDPFRDDTILDLSVGYDLAGVRSAPVRSWIASMKDARAEVDSLRREIPDELRRLRGLDFRTSLSDQATLSTFHGCPAEEIEAIALFLMEEMGLHVTVKLNPTLLGRETVDALLHDVLGYPEVETRAEDFAKDLQWEPALEMADRLTERARALGREVRLKLSNTLVVRNHRSFFPPGESVMYLSGPPLHVITLNLLERVRRARPEVPLSFSAGVDSRNFGDCVALGLAPVTVCTDLLKPGGYSRLPRYLGNLEERMREQGARTVADYVVTSCGTGEEAIARVVPPSPLREELLASLRSDPVDLRAVFARSGEERRYDELVRTAAFLNTPVVVARATSDPRYRAESLRPPRRIGRHLALFDCINCDKCLPACPNDANFAYEAAPLAREYQNYRVEGGRALPVPGGRFEVRERHQLATFQDFCNDCGNCDTFCPEDGGPYLEKPRFFGSLAAWRRLADRDGFHVERGESADVMRARLDGEEYRLEVDREADQAVFTDGRVTLELRHRERAPVGAGVAPGTPEGHTLDVGAYLRMAVLLDGVL
ncbi:MAG TPA: 4Fe-4S dicluster domain-containing protein, partial [Vicinamibacteria bacterium]|nr:4Fe-4S dicluster domain-containing protein [Vicinamibacteria bacterium]